MSRNILLTTTFLLFCSICFCQEKTDEIKDKIKGLVKQLGDVSFEIREKAKIELIKISEEQDRKYRHFIVKELEKVLNSDDAEVRLKAESILDRIRWVKIKNLENGKLVNMIFGEDGNLVCAFSGGRLKMLAIETGKVIKEFDNLDEKISSICVSQDKRYLITFYKCKIRIWDTKEWKVLRTYEWHNSNITAVSFSPDSKLVASGSIDGTLKVWDIDANKEIKTFRTCDKVTSVSFSPDGKYLVFLILDGGCKVWNTKEWNLIKTITDSPQCVKFSPDGKYLAIIDFHSTKIKILDTKKWDVVKTLKKRVGIKLTPVYFRVLNFSQDGKLLAAGMNDGTISIFEK